jgi:tRNA(Ile)-lysidine synthase
MALDAHIATRRHPLVADVRHRLARRCDVPDDATLVAGCSGGADSTALLLSLAAMGRTVTAVHVHHHLRPEADDEAASVERLCGLIDVPVRVEHVHPGDEPGNTAAVARRLRYATLVSAAREVGASIVAVAHHAEDQLETMLMALARGCGPDGLAGMAWSAPCPVGPGAEDIRVVRPLLDVPKNRCVDLCNVAGVPWCEDPSNRDTDQARVRLRRDVLPVLETLWPGAAERVTATTEMLRLASAALDAEVARRFGPPGRRVWDREPLRETTPTLIAAGLRRAVVDEIGAPSDKLGQRQLIEAAELITSDDRRPRSFDWPHGLKLSVTAQRLELVTATRSAPGRSCTDAAAAEP